MNFFRPFLFLAALVLLDGRCFAAEEGTLRGSPAGNPGLLFTLAPPAASVAAGSNVQVSLVAFNPGTEEVPFVPAPVLAGELIAGADSWRVELKSAAGGVPTVIAPGKFVVQSYSLLLPASTEGRVILELAQWKGEVARTAMVVGRAPAPGGPVAAPAVAGAARQPALSAFERTFVGRMAAHKPIYFIYGPGKPGAKFQFSFKYRLASFDHGADDGVPATLQFGFTQRSLWDIDGNSSPFYDTSYMPELMFESLEPMPDKSDGWLTWLGYQAGFRHESNGRAGTISRSFDTASLRPAFAIGLFERWRLVVIPEVFTYIGGLGNNPDLKEYRGYGRLRAVLARRKGLSLMATGIAGEAFDHGSLQLDLTVPFRTDWLSFGGYFLLQYFNGYGESLLAYDEKSSAIRGGISFVR